MAATTITTTNNAGRCPTPRKLTKEQVSEPQDLFEIFGEPIDWRDQLSDLVASDESLREHWETISALISLGLKARAAELREEAIYSDIDEPLRSALDEIENQRYC